MTTNISPAQSTGTIAINRATLDQYGITDEIVRTVSMWCSHVTAPGRSKPGQPIKLDDRRDTLIDAHDDVVRFNGEAANFTAAAYYAQAGITYAQASGARVPAWAPVVLEFAQQAQTGGAAGRAAQAAHKRAASLATERGHGTDAKPGKDKPAPRRRTAKTTPAAPATATKNEPAKPRQTQKPAPAPAPVVAAPATPAPTPAVPAPTVPAGRLAVPGCSITTCSAPGDVLMTHTVGGEQVVEAVCRPHGDACATVADPTNAVTFAPIHPDGLALHTRPAQAAMPGTTPWAVPADMAWAWTLTRVEIYLNKKNQTRVAWRYANGQTAMFAHDEQVTGHYVPGVLSR